MQPLESVTRTYSWGSRSLIPTLKGQPVSDRPVAEEWYGAHPAAPSLVNGDKLNDVIAAAPEKALGVRVTESFGQRLPFLLKLLASAEPLSLQAHPTKKQAEEGFARENAEGIPLEDPERNYKDDNHKPELIVALTDFYAMAGFRPVDETLELFAALGCPELDRYATLLQAGVDNDAHGADVPAATGAAGHEPAAEAAAEAVADAPGAGEGSESESGESESGESDDYRALFTTWITIPAATRKELISAIIAAGHKLIEQAGPDDWKAGVMQAVIDINDQYPGDIGVLGALLLNHIRLAPGEAIYLDAGQLHAYVSGLGVEIMASSDNVLRGGLTPKYVDVPELVKVLNFAATADPRVPAVDRCTPERCRGAHEWNYPVPVADFNLSRCELQVGDSIDIELDGPAIFLCTSGTVQLDGASSEQAAELKPAEAVWVPASDKAVTITAPQGADGQTCAQVFIARA